MAERRPIVLIGNTLHELPAGDVIAGMTSYYNKSEIDLKLQNIAVEAIDVNAVVNQLDLYSKADVNSMFNLKADISSVYNRNDIIAFLAKKANLTDIYNKSEVYSRGQTYSRAETYARSEMYSKQDIDLKFTSFGAVSSSDVYTKINIDAMMNDYAKKSEIVTTSSLITSFNSLKSELSSVYMSKTDGVSINFLSDNEYLTKTSADLKYASLNGTSSYVTLTTLESKLALKANIADIYTKSQIDSQFGATNYYTKDELYSKTQINSIYYNQSYINDIVLTLNTKITSIQSQVNTISESGGTSTGTGTIDTSLYYNKTDIDAKFSTYVPLSVGALMTNVYSKGETYDRTALYTKIEVDGIINTTKTWTGTTYYTKAEIETKLQNVSIDTSTLVSKTELASALSTVVPVLKELDLITVASASTKTYTINYNSKFIQVFINRKILYKEEYTATNGTSITFIIDLIEGDKIKVFTI